MSNIDSQEPTLTENKSPKSNQNYILKTNPKYDGDQSFQNLSLLKSIVHEILSVFKIKLKLIDRPNSLEIDKRWIIVDWVYLRKPKRN